MATLITNGSVADVQAKINAASAGDAVVIPTGSYTWAGTVNLNKPIILQAASITANNPPSPTVTITHNNGANTLIAVMTGAVGDTTLAGISFQPASATGNYINVGSSGSNPGIFILNNCLFEIPNFQLNNAIEWNIIGGLVYQCMFQSSVDGAGQGYGSGSGCIQFKNQSQWYDPSTFGALDTTGRKNLYIEDCTFFNVYNQAVDVDDCGRLNIRYCNLINSQILTHGITSMFGGRQIDLNNCTFEFRIFAPNSSGIRAVNMNRWGWWRAGSGRVWGNAIDAISSSDWGNKTCWQFSDEPLSRAGSGNGGNCETQAQWPGTRWPGTGGNGVTHPSGVVVTPSFRDPIYFWNNTAGPHSNGTTSWGCTDYGPPLQSCNNGPTSAVFLINRDLFFSAPNNNPSPPYTPYVYPHPLRTGGGGGNGGGGTPQQGTVSNQMGRIVAASPKVIRSAVAKLK
jgi:hypothetical protein